MKNSSTIIGFSRWWDTRFCCVLLALSIPPGARGQEVASEATTLPLEPVGLVLVGNTYVPITPHERWHGYFTKLCWALTPPWPRYCIRTLAIYPPMMAAPHSGWGELLSVRFSPITYPAARPRHFRSGRNLGLASVRIQSSGSRRASRQLRGDVANRQQPAQGIPARHQTAVREKIAG